jgi:hypothetical protein
MKAMLERKGFDVLVMEKSGHFFESLVQLTTLYIYTLFSSRNMILNTLGTIIFIAPVNIFGYLISAIMPKRYELYHNLVIIVKKGK